MEESDFELANDTDSMYDAFYLPQYNLGGLRIFLGRRRHSSVEVGERHEWDTLDSGDSDKQDWAVFNNESSESDDGGDDEVEDDGHDYVDKDDPFTLPRRFVDKHDTVAKPMGQAIDLALCLMETQKSIDIMAGVAKRMVEDSPEDIQHITPQSTLRECKTLARRWIAKLRQEEFFKIQAVPMGDDTVRVGTSLRCWHRRVHMDDTATLADYLPHNAGLLEIDVELLRKLNYHTDSSDDDSPIELQKCLFHVANLLVHGVQRFWVAFLMSKMAESGTEEPLAVYSDATIHLERKLSEPSAGYHWEHEFFHGAVRWLHHKESLRTDFNRTGGFGRGLSMGDAYLQRPDGTEQRIDMDSIIGCLEYDFSEVLLTGLGTCGKRVSARGFPFLDYDS